MAPTAGTNSLILHWAVLFNTHKMLVDRVKAGVERRRRGDDAEPDQDSAWNSNDAVLRQWERIETQDYFRRRMGNRAPVRDSSCCSGRQHNEVKNLAFQIRSSWAHFGFPRVLRSLQKSKCRCTSRVGRERQFCLALYRRYSG